jgi:hypothetical protein
MRRTGKILASVFLIAGLVAGIGISYSDSGHPALQDTTDGFKDCPAYPTAKHIFEARSENNWVAAGEMAKMGGPATDGSLAGNLPWGNFIDDFIFDKMSQDGIPHAAPCTDAEFIRRAFLDVIGRIPSAIEVKDFLADTSSDKRARLVDQLLARPEYVDRMTMFFGDLFQNGYNILYYGRSRFNEFLKQEIRIQRPYNDMVTEILTAAGDSWAAGNGAVNFLARAWEPMVNQFDVRDNIAANVAKAFLGVPALCISCHNGARHLEQVNTFLAGKRRSDLWGLAAFFSGVTFQRQQRLRTPNRFAYTFSEASSTGYNINATQARGGIRPQRRAGSGDPTVIAPNYFFTDESPTTPSARWRGQLAQYIARDPQFAKATVNYLWKEIFGMGIVDPPDAFDLARDDQATHPELLDALAQEFVNGGYDIKYMVELMLKSTTYQLSAQFPGTWEGRYAKYFARHIPKRMTAEMLLDSIVQSSHILNTYYVENYNGRVDQYQWAMQLPDTAEPRTVANVITGQQATANNASRGFLNLFFRGNRNGDPRKSEGSILQTLGLMNNAMVINRVRYGRGGIVDTLVDDTSYTSDQIVDELFLHTLSRYPTAQEKTEALALVNANRAQGTEDLYLVLLNKLDFIFY